MPLPLVASGVNCRPEGDGALPSGMFPGVTYQEQVVKLDPGDCVLFATDGLHETRNRDGIEFYTGSMEQVWAQCWRKSAKESWDFIFEQLLTFADGGMPHDDITAVVLKVGS